MSHTHDKVLVVKVSVRMAVHKHGEVLGDCYEGAKSQRDPGAPYTVGRLIGQGGVLHTLKTTRFDELYVGV